MKRELASALRLCLMLILLAAMTTAQQRSITEKSYMQAREVLEAGIKAVGGAES